MSPSCFERNRVLDYSVLSCIPGVCLMLKQPRNDLGLKDDACRSVDLRPQFKSVDTAPHPISEKSPRPIVSGKFIFVDGEKYWVKGVTYGTFRPDLNGDQFPEKDTVSSDLAMVASHGFNTVRVYTVPPKWLLDAA